MTPMEDYLNSLESQKSRKKKNPAAVLMGKLSQKAQREKLGEEGYRQQQIEKSHKRKPRAEREIKK